VTLAEKLDRLFESVHPAGRGELTPEELAQLIHERGGPDIDAARIHRLRAGDAEAPGDGVMAALALGFGVPAAYFSESAVAEQVDAELALLCAIRDNGVSRLKLCRRDPDEKLSPEALRTLAALINQLGAGKSPRES
jgi:hypothetical protein